MPKKVNARGIGSEDLHKILRRGHESQVARARIQWAEAEGFRRYVASLVGVDRVYPSFLPTQASGRWSITDPPLINFPDDAKADKRGLPHLRRLLYPDPGTWWLCWDWDALHAKFIALAAGEENDIGAFLDATRDLHSETASAMFRLNLSPTTHLGKGDRRRHLAKTVRYALCNSAPGPKEAYGVLEAKEVEEQGLTLQDLLKAAKLYIAAKPKYSQWKREYASQAIAQGVSRSLEGRPRPLYGPNWNEKAKAAISHFLQGTEVDKMEQCVIDICNEYPDVSLVYPTHDAVKLEVSETRDPRIFAEAVRPIVEAPITINGRSLPLTATWEWIDEHGGHHALGK